MNDFESNPALEIRVTILSLELSRQFNEIDLNIANSAKAADAIIQAYCNYCRKMLELQDLPQHYHSYFKMMLSDLANYQPRDDHEAYDYLSSEIQSPQCNGSALVGMMLYMIGDMIFKSNSELRALQAEYHHAPQSEKSIIAKKISETEIKILKQAIILQYARLFRYYLVKGYRAHSATPVGD